MQYSPPCVLSPIEQTSFAVPTGNRARTRPQRPSYSHLTAALLLACIQLCTALAWADGGELTLSATADQEWASIHHPQAQTSGHRGVHLYVPRFGGSLEYGLSNRLRLGLVGRGSLPASKVFAITALGDTYTGGALAASTRDILATAVLTGTLVDGETLFFELSAEGGFAIRRWQLTHRIDDAGSHPITGEPGQSSWQASPYLRAGLQLRWRPWQYVSFTAAPYLAGTLPRSAALGASLAVNVPLGVGPSF